STRMCGPTRSSTGTSRRPLPAAAGVPVSLVRLVSSQSEESLANGKPTFLLMSDASCRYWYSRYGRAERNLGHQVWKPGVRRVCLVSGSAVDFGCLPFHCRGWPEAIPENVGPVLLLPGRRVRRLLRPPRHVGSATIGRRQRRRLRTSGPDHFDVRHRSVRPARCSDACDNIAEVYRSHSDVGRCVFGRIPRLGTPAAEPP